MGGRITRARASVRRAATACTVLLIAMLACSSVPGQGPTPTAVPVTPSKTPTRTPRPTPTKRPTATPDFSATQAAQDFDALLSEFQAAGYIESTDGRIYPVESVDKKLAAQDWYWWFQGEALPDFIFTGHFAWSTAVPTLGSSGCALTFGMNEDFWSYNLILDDTRLLLESFEGEDFFRIQPTSGTDRFDFPNPAEADVALIAHANNILVFVDGELTKYRLRETNDAGGQFAMSMYSATSQGYGTHCAITDALMWTAE